jgi:hypothetical protein
LATLAGCGKAHFAVGKTPSAAEAGLILRYLAARLEAVPFQNAIAEVFFRSLLEIEMTDSKKPSRSVRSQDLRFKIETERETDGRWIAEISDMPGVLAYGKTEAEAKAKAYALALRV